MIDNSELFDPWLEQCCDRDPLYWHDFSDLYASWADYTRRRNNWPGSFAKLSRWLKDIGMERYRGAGGVVYYQGLRLKEPKATIRVDPQREPVDTFETEAIRAKREKRNEAVRRWLAACCDQRPAWREPFRDLYASYCDYAQAHGDPELSRQMLAKLLRGAGFQPLLEKTGARSYGGLGLVAKRPESASEAATAPAMPEHRAT